MSVFTLHEVLQTPANSLLAVPVDPGVARILQDAITNLFQFGEASEVFDCSGEQATALRATRLFKDGHGQLLIEDGGAAEKLPSVERPRHPNRLSEA